MGAPVDGAADLDTPADLAPDLDTPAEAGPADATLDAGGGAPCAKPGPSNTGPSDPAALKASGSITTTHDGQVIENVDVSGMIRIKHDNVTLRNFRVETTAHYCIEISGAVGSLIEHGEVVGCEAAGLLASDATIRFLDIHDVGADGGKAGSSSTWECNWFHHLGKNEGAHADGLQNSGGNSNIVIRWNNFDMPIPEGPNGPGAPYHSNAALMFATNFGPIDNVLVEGNYMNGGNYTMYIIEKTSGYGGTPTSITIRNNKFGSDHRYGLFSNKVSPSELFACGNVWEKSGLPVTFNNHGDACP